MKSTAKAEVLETMVYSEGYEHLAFTFDGVNGLAKRVFDHAVAMSIFVFTLPLLLTIAFVIKIQDGGPVLFRQIRCGRNGKAFYCYKFRTMKVNAEAALQEVLAADPEARAEWEKTHKLQKDPRITGFGRLLRKSSLDELPQLLNILAGEMSLIGPRPVTFAELERYGNNVHYYYAARPGVSGLWQVNGRNHLTYEQRVAYDIEYVRNWSFMRDMKIMAKTVPAVLLFDGAY